MTTSSPASVGTVIHVDPATVAVAPNIRANADLGREGFAADIADRGVLQPVTAWWDGIAGAWQVLDGQRRTLAAKDARLQSIPVYVIGEVEGEQARILGQFAANEHRKDLDPLERVDAVQALFGLGMTADQIRRKTHKPRAFVDAALTVAGSTFAREVIESAPTLDLVAAAELADIAAAGDLPPRIEHAIGEDPGRLVHEIALHRERQAEEARRNALIDAEIDRLRADGDTVLDRGVDLGSDLHTQYGLRTGNGSTVTDAVWEQIAGRTARVMVNYSGDHVTVQWFATADVAAAAGLHIYTSASSTSAPSSEEQLEEKRRQRALAVEWKAATAVRRNAIAEYLGNSLAKPRQPAVLHLAALGAAGLLPDREHQYRDIAAAWLGVREPAPGEYAATAGTRFVQWLDEHPQRTLNLVAAFAIARVESYLEPRSDMKPWALARYERPALARYLTALADVGYTLAPIEQGIVDADLADREAAA